jgi:flavodoxin
MPQTIVVVAFYSRSGTTERLATSAAVGAVQARAGIRMRRVPDVDAAAALERHPDAREDLLRMQKEYVAPREADILATNALIVGSPSDLDPSSGEWSPLFALLAQLHADGKLLGKVGAAVGPRADVFAAALGQVGFTVVPPTVPDEGASEDDAVARAVALGRQVVALADTVKSAPARG